MRPQRQKICRAILFQLSTKPRAFTAPELRQAVEGILVVQGDDPTVTLGNMQSELSLLVAANWVQNDGGAYRINDEYRELTRQLAIDHDYSVDATEVARLSGENLVSLHAKLARLTAADVLTRSNDRYEMM